MNTKRTVVITGAAGGIGAVAVRRFLANGDRVVATDTSEDALRALAEELGPSERLLTTKADISREQECGAVAEVARHATGQVNVLVNVAGFFPIQPFLDMTAEDWRKIIDINLTGGAA